MGVSHNGAERWNWFRCNAQGHQHVTSLGGYFSGDPLFVMFVLADDQPALLRYVRLGEPTTEAKIHTSPNRSFVPLAAVFDASGSTTAAGEIIKYDWDWNDDGVFEQTTGDVATANHTYTEVGTYRPAVRVTSEYGEQDTASMEVIVAAEWTHSWGTAGGEQISGVCVDQDLSCYGVGYTINAEDDLDLLLLKWDLAGDLVWARSWGGLEFDKGVDAYADSSGAVYVLGTTASFGSGGVDILLQRWEANGNLVWSRTWGGDATDVAHRFSQQDGDLYIAGQTKSFAHSNGDALVLKFSSSGDLQWARSVGEGYSDMALAIRAFKPFSIPYTGVHVAGATSSYKSAGSGQDVLYMKFSADGELTRTLTWSGGNSQTGRSVSVSGLMGENIYIGGSSQSDLLMLEVGTGGGLVSRVWDSGTTDSATDMVRLSEGFLICGLTGVGTSDENALLLNLSPEGAVQGCELWDLAGTKDSWLDIVGHPGGVAVGGYATRAEGGNWSDFSGSIGDIAGSWTEHNVDSVELDGQSGSPSTEATDITSNGVVDAGGGVELDALMAAREVP
jgi:PKD repeat protein